MHVDCRPILSYVAYMVTSFTIGLGYSSHSMEFPSNFHFCIDVRIFRLGSHEVLKIDVELVSVDSIARWRQPTSLIPTHCCSVERRVVMWVRCRWVDMAATTRLESLCRRGRVVVVVDCSAVECERCRSQRPIRDLHCLMTSEVAGWRPWLKT